MALFQSEKTSNSLSAEFLNKLEFLDLEEEESFEEVYCYQQYL